MSNIAVAGGGFKSVRTARHQKGDRQTNIKQAAQDSNQYQVPYQQRLGCLPSHMAPGPYATTQVPLFYNQTLGQFAGGAHTISRASNLHKHFAGEGQPTATGGGGAKSQHNGGPNLVYYDQPYLGYAGGPMMGVTPLLASGGPGTAQSLAVREPKERGPIPFVNGGGTIGPALMRQYAANAGQRYHRPHSKQVAMYQEAPVFSPLELSARLNKPLCRCRVMYLGSSVPHITKNGLHGIQEPLKHLYPEEKFSSSSLRRRTVQRQQQQQQQNVMTIDISHLSASLGIDSWLSVWSNGLLLENVDEFGRDIRRFFSIESLHYCAAVRYFDTSTLTATSSRPSDTDHDLNNNGQDSLNSSGIEQDQENRRPEVTTSPSDSDQQQQQQQKRAVRFLPLDAPIFQYPNMMDPNHPPVFAAIMRRTSGVKVLECHAFICRRDAASNALVRCCTHAYADFLSAKRISAEFGVEPAPGSFNTSYNININSNTLGSNRADSRRAGSQRNSIPADLVSVAKSKRQDGQQRGRKPARSLSTGGTNSQEMTHSDENSLDAADSEDNYAIIMRQGVGGHESALRPRATRPAERHNQPKLGRESRDSARHRQASKKGSSKSLFRSFMPNEQLALPTAAQSELAAADDSPSGSSSRRQATRANRLASFDSAAQLKAGNRLSHSLDFLQAQQANTGAICCPGANVWPRPGDSGRDSIKYSIVANKQRRHSKSMQQLLQVPTGVPKEPAEGGARGISFAWTRASSCQDMARNSELSRSSSISSHRRRRGQRRRRKSESRRSSVSSHNQSSLAGSQGKLNKLGDGQQRDDHDRDWRSRSRVRQLDTSACIYATCSSEESPLPALLPPPPPPVSLAHHSEPAAQVRILRADYCTNQQKAASSSSTSGSTRAKKSSRRHREQQHQQAQQPQQPLAPNSFVEPMSGYYHFMQPPPPPPPLPPGPLDPQRASYYNPTGLVYCAPSIPAPYYGASTQMGVPQPPPPQPAAYYPFAGQQTPAGQLFAAQQDSALYNGAYLLPGTSKSATLKRPSSKASKEALAATLKRESKHSRKSQTLATRFRCLSPPLSFLTGGVPDRHSRLSAMGAPAQQQHAAQQQMDSNNNNLHRQSVSSISSQASSCQVSPGHIVSGKPGFMSTSADGDQMAPLGAPMSQPAGRNRPKMSWIKRLSLTLSSGSSANARQSSKSAALRAEQAAEFYRNIQEAEQPLELPAVPSGEPTEHLEALDSAPATSNQNSNQQANNPAGGTSSQPSAQSTDLHNNPPEARSEPSSELAESGKKAHDEEAKSKRKKGGGGFFSGSLTLGRKSRIKASP